MVVLVEIDVVVSFVFVNDSSILIGVFDDGGVEERRFVILGDFLLGVLELGLLGDLVAGALLLVGRATGFGTFVVVSRVVAGSGARAVRERC